MRLGAVADALYPLRTWTYDRRAADCGREGATRAREAPHDHLPSRDGEEPSSARDVEEDDQAGLSAEPTALGSNGDQLRIDFPDTVNDLGQRTSSSSPRVRWAVRTEQHLLRDDPERAL